VLHSLGAGDAGCERCPWSKKEPARRPVHQENSIFGGDIEGAPKGPRMHAMSPRWQG